MNEMKLTNSLEWRFNMADRLLLSLGLARQGRELTAIFGKGDESDNLKALFNWVRTLDEDVALDHRRVSYEFEYILRYCILQMKRPPSLRRAVEEGEAFVPASVHECENVAHSLEFMVRLYFLALEARAPLNNA